MEQQNNNIKENKKSSNNTLVIILAILLAISTGLLIWQFLKGQKLDDQVKTVIKEKEVLITDKESVTSELNLLKAEYETMQTNNAEMKAQIEEDKRKIEEYIEQAKKMEGNEKELNYFRAKIKELQKSKELFVKQIDSLKLVNQSLSDENTKVKADIQKTQGENQMLTDKVTRASLLKGVNLVIEPLNDNLKITDRSKRVKEFNICVTLVDNEVAKPGEKSVYARIVKPGGNILVKSKDNLFTAYGEQIAYSTTTSVNYQNKQIRCCAKYSVAESELSAGVYDVEVFTDGEMIASGSVTLK